MIVFRSFMAAAVLCGLGLPAQAPSPLLDEARSLRLRAIAMRDDPVACAGMAPAAEALLDRCRREWPELPGIEVGRSAVELHGAFALVGPGGAADERVLELADAEFARRPADLDGRALLLLARGHAVRTSGKVVRHADEWQKLWRSTQGPKRPWIACEAARQLINNCGQPAVAEAMLSETLTELQRMAPWSEAVRAALAADPELFIPGRHRERAGAWRDARGQALLLRAYAREQHGRLVQAVSDIAAAREDFAWSGNAHRLANCDHMLAVIWLQLGRHELAAQTAASARKAYEFGHESEPPGGPRQPDANGVVAMRKVEIQAALAGGGDPAAAVEALTQLLRHEGFYIGDTNVDACTTLVEALLRLPHDPAREQVIAEMLEHVRDYAGIQPDHIVWWRAGILRAEWKLLRGDAAGAHALLVEIADPLARHRHRPLQIRRLALLARCELAAGRPQAALAAAAAAADTVSDAVLAEEMWRLDGVASAFASQFGELLAIAKQAVDAAVGGGVAAADDLARLYALVQRFHGFEAMCRSISDGDGHPSPETQALVERVRSARGAYANWLRLQPRHPLAQRERMRRLAEAQSEVEASETALAAWRNQPESSSTSSPGVFAPVALAAVQAALQPGEVLVECVEADGAAWAFVVTQGSARVEPLPAGPEWRRCVAALRAYRDGAERTTEVLEVPALVAAAESLWRSCAWFERLLVDPSTRRVLWSPEGSLAQVPLAALPWQGKPLVATLPVAHVVSGSLLAQRRARGGRPANADMRLLALANPRYPAATVQALVQRSLAGSTGFAALPASAEEALGVALGFASDDEAARLRAIAAPAEVDGELVGGRYRLLLGGAATEAALAAADLRGVDVLHLACHGEAQPEAPTMSFLALSLPAEIDGGAEDGLLRLAELGRMRGDFELVTLSACGTAAGAMRGHDAVAGLAWAAQLAGARRVLASQWRCADAGTRDFMLAFYAAWRGERMGAAAALAAAQRAMIGKLPVHTWAAFSLWGEPE